MSEMIYSRLCVRRPPGPQGWLATAPGEDDPEDTVLDYLAAVIADNFSFGDIKLDPKADVIIANGEVNYGLDFAEVADLAKVGCAWVVYVDPKYEYEGTAHWDNADGNGVYSSGWCEGHTLTTASWRRIKNDAISAHPLDSAGQAYYCQRHVDMVLEPYVRADPTNDDTTQEMTW